MSDATAPAPKFQIGDTVVNKAKTYEGKPRIVREINPIEGGDNMLIVRINEDDEKSLVWSWFASLCELAPRTFKVGDYVTLGSSDLVGKIIDEREHWKTHEPQYRVALPGDAPDKERWVTAVALHLVKSTSSIAAQIESVAYDLSATEALAAPLDKECPKCGRLLAIAEAGDPEHVVYHECWYCNDTSVIEDPRDADALLRAAQALADEQEKTIAAEERAKVAELRVSKLEAKLREMEICVTQPQPITATQTTCVEFKTLEQVLYGGAEKIANADRELSETVNAGWSIENFTVLDQFSFDGNAGGGYPTRYITFKRTVTTPTQPTRGTAGAHAALTGDYPRQSMQQRSPFRSTQEFVSEVPAVGTIVESKKEIKLGPIGTSIKEIGVEATGQMMTSFAIQDALKRGRERIDAIPAFNRPLHTLKASN